MRIDWYTLALQTVNFAVLVWLLHRLLYRPVLRMVDARQEHIAAQQSAARDALAQAKDELAGITAARSSIAAERAQALASASAEADALKRARIASAEQEAATCLDEGRKKLASEREQALAGVQTAALDLAGEFLARLIAALPACAQAECWLERIEKHLVSLPALEREALSRELSSEAPLTVVTASALAPQSLELWREKLARLVGSDAVVFAVDASLGAGAELRFPGATLTFSLRGELATLRGELESRAKGATALR